MVMRAVSYNPTETYVARRKVTINDRVFEQGAVVPREVAKDEGQYRTWFLGRLLAPADGNLYRRVNFDKRLAQPNERAAPKPEVQPVPKAMISQDNPSASNNQTAERVTASTLSAEAQAQQDQRAELQRLMEAAIKEVEQRVGYLERTGRGWFIVRFRGNEEKVRGEDNAQRRLDGMREPLGIVCESYTYLSGGELIAVEKSKAGDQVVDGETGEIKVVTVEPPEPDEVELPDEDTPSNPFNRPLVGAIQQGEAA
jgi:hypothetical protein